MPIRPFDFMPTDIIEWSRWLESTEVAPSNGTITDATFGARTASSVIGRPQNTDGQPSDIVLGSNQFLVNRAGTVRGDGLLDADIPSGIARDTEVALAASSAQSGAEATAAAALVAHVGDSDPHPGYVLENTILNGSVTYDPPSLADGAGDTTTVTVTGAALGDFALASFSLDLQGISVTAYVSSANTVSVRFQNESGGILDLGSGTLKARVWK